MPGASISYAQVLNTTATYSWPTSEPGTGWVIESYEWSNLDNATWITSILFKIYFTFSLIRPLKTHYKKAVIWVIITAAIVINFAASISGIVFLDCLVFSADSSRCNVQLHVGYTLDGAAFLSGYVLLFYRKFCVVPSKLGRTGLVDLVVMLICMAFSLALNIPCICGDMSVCFGQDMFQAVAAGLSFVYFDMFYMIQISQYNIDRRRRNEALELSYATGGMAAVYIFGSVSYKTWGGNFYTNMLWNVGWCLWPVFAIKSVMSRKFVKLLLHNTGDKEATKGGSLSNLGDFLPQRGPSLIKADSTFSLSTIKSISFVVKGKDPVVSGTGDSLQDLTSPSVPRPAIRPSSMYQREPRNSKMKKQGSLQQIADPQQSTHTPTS
ncbi:hypothetical protein BJ741DRAFT_617423 [Chytriomyces cf. hyalinus JEL632]|nr:hypothetical protein BJ741DRAFT_617423 [Chytriomyces cf. hyalinus JEL632]